MVVRRAMGERGFMLLFFLRGLEVLEKFKN